MQQVYDSRHPLLGLINETSRLHARLRSVFAAARQSVGLGDSEIMVLSAVVDADRPRTVPQLGRLLSHPRQIIQRAANALQDAGLVQGIDNPDHKRAVLLIPTPRGIALKREADVVANAIAQDLMSDLDASQLSLVTDALAAVRHQLEGRLREL